MKKIILAFDSFKGSAGSLDIARYARQAIRKELPYCEVLEFPVADGGEGTTEAICTALEVNKIFCEVHDPLMNPVEVSYGITKDGATAILEMASASGLPLVAFPLRNPMNTTSYGTGEVILDALNRGCRQFIVGLGGSATNDGGVGMLQALGYGFLNKEGKQVPFGARGLEVLEEITDEYVLPELAECEFRVACDVTNILCGENGCSAVYGPQKGATPSMIMQMDNWLKHYAKLAEKKFTKANANQAGTGAAGGLGFAFLSFTNAVLESGIKIVLEETCLEKYMENADIVITGEGRLDGQTAMGKAPVGVARFAKKHDIPVIAFAGSVTKEAVACNQNGIDAFFPILRGVVTLEEAMKPENAKANMTDTVEQVFRLMNMGRK